MSRPHDRNLRLTSISRIPRLKTEMQPEFSQWEEEATDQGEGIRHQAEAGVHEGAGNVG